MRMVSTTHFLIATAVIAVAAVPLVLKLVPRNRFYGFRTRSTLANDEIWYRANRFAGALLLAACAVSLALLWRLPDADLGTQGVVFAGPMLIAVIVSIVYASRIR